MHCFENLLGNGLRLDERDETELTVALRADNLKPESLSEKFCPRNVLRRTGRFVLLGGRRLGGGRHDGTACGSVRRQNPKIASEMSLGRRRRGGQGGQALGPEGTTRAARRAMKASGSRSTDAVPSDHGFLKSSLTFPSSRILRRSLARGRRTGAAASARPMAAPPTIPTAPVAKPDFTKLRRSMLTMTFRGTLAQLYRRPPYLPHHCLSEFRLGGDLQEAFNRFEPVFRAVTVASAEERAADIHHTCCSPVA